MRHALRNYSNPRALRRNPLTESTAIATLIGARASESWNPHVVVLRHVIDRCVSEVLQSSNEADRRPLEIVLHGVMSGRTIRAIAADLSYGREWLHKTWWSEAVRGVTTVMLLRYLRVPSEPLEVSTTEMTLLRPAS